MYNNKNIITGHQHLAYIQDNTEERKISREQNRLVNPGKIRF